MAGSTVTLIDMRSLRPQPGTFGIYFYFQNVKEKTFIYPWLTIAWYTKISDSMVHSQDLFDTRKSIDFFLNGQSTFLQNSPFNAFFYIHFRIIYWCFYRTGHWSTHQDTFLNRGPTFQKASYISFYLNNHNNWSERTNSTSSFARGAVVTGAERMFMTPSASLRP